MTDPGGGRENLCASIPGPDIPPGGCDNETGPQQHIQSAGPGYSRAMAFSNCRCSVPLESLLPMGDRGAMVHGFGSFLHECLCLPYLVPTFRHSCAVYLHTHTMYVTGRATVKKACSH